MTTTITRRTRITRTGTRRPLPGDHETAGSRETSSFAQLASLGILGRMAQRGMDPLETENLVGEERGPVDTGGTEACESTERCSLSDGSCVASGNKPSRSHASRRRKCGKLWPTDSPRSPALHCLTAECAAMLHCHEPYYRGFRLTCLAHQLAASKPTPPGFQQLSSFMFFQWHWMSAVLQLVTVCWCKRLVHDRFLGAPAAAKAAAMAPPRRRTSGGSRIKPPPHSETPGAHALRSSSSRFSGGSFSQAPCFRRRPPKSKAAKTGLNLVGLFPETALLFC